MVTKRYFNRINISISSVLAKIHMVTKLAIVNCLTTLRSVLAKIHMVTKLDNGQ